MEGPYERFAAVAKKARAEHGDDLDAALAGNEALRRAARACRIELAQRTDAQLGPFDPRHLDALVEVPRERFIRAEDLERAADDIPLPLDDAGLSTISAPHAYLLSFRLLGLAEGDSLVELGTGTGYGAALAAHILGPKGRLSTFEIDRALAARARALLAQHANVSVVEGDAMPSAPSWKDHRKIVCTFAVAELPTAWLDAVGEGMALVAPVGARESEQRLVRVVREGGELRASDHGAVRYVKNRSIQ